MRRVIYSLLMLTMFNSAIAQSNTIDADFGLVDKPIETAVVVNKKFVGVPIQIDVPLNKESRIEFFSPIQKVGIRPEASSFLAYESYSNQILFTVKKPISTRIKLQLQGNIVVPINIRVVDVDIKPVALVVALPETETVDRPDINKQMVLTGYSKPNQNKLNAVELIRYAMQYFYSPARLQRTQLLGEPKKLIREPVKMYRTSMVETVPLVQWMVDGVYITAIQVTNKLTNSVPLDPRYIRGKIRLASFYRNKLAARGNKGDETVLITVSDSPLRSLDLRVVELESEDDDG